MAELITLEQEYVSCLVELLPLGVGHQELASELRHECSTLQGLRDRLLAFHRAYFLKELQGCTIHPLRVGSCFLRYVSDSRTPPSDPHILMGCQYPPRDPHILKEAPETPP